MNGLIYGVGLLAACLTSLSYIPQVRKASAPGATEDLSLRTLVILGSGLALWIIYGAIKSDLVIMAANCVGLILVGALLAFKIRDGGQRP
jgi:MtN3 and saliva related transmembrane protein